MTKFSNSETIILQFDSEKKAGNIQYNGKESSRTEAHVFIPTKENGFFITCPLNYFQDSTSLNEKWILNNTGQKLPLDSLNNLKRILITIKKNEEEKIVTIPMFFSVRLLDYFKLDINHNIDRYRGFDCYAFISLLANVKYHPENPDFEYEKKEPEIGDFVVLACNENLPNDIKHWALYLGNNQYISKFGRSGEGTDSHVAIMTVEGMKLLYESDFLYVAIPKENTEPWNGLE